MTLNSDSLQTTGWSCNSLTVRPLPVKSCSSAGCVEGERAERVTHEISQVSGFTQYLRDQKHSDQLQRKGALRTSRKAYSQDPAKAKNV